MILGIGENMAKGTVKSFNREKGYGFIRMDANCADIFVHFSAVQEAGFKGLRKGQKISFEIFDNRGKAAAKNLRIDDSIRGAPEVKLVPVQNRVMQNVRSEMSPKSAEIINKKHTPISCAALELIIAKAVRDRDPECGALVGVIVERVVPKSPGSPNWTIKGVKYGKVDRDRCLAVISSCVEEVQREFEVID